jgi:Fe-S oxidoreductase
MNYDPFVLPFSFGLVAVLTYLMAKYVWWFFKIERADRRKGLRGIFSRRFLGVLGEIFMEVLLHRKVFRKNFVLGYMHMSIALGWFLLIVVGTVESKLINPSAFNKIWDPIFFRFFHHEPQGSLKADLLAAIMDGILLFILSGILLAWGKRVYSKLLGMKRTTKHVLADRLTLTILWFIFPLRLLAESFTAATYQNGSFFTQPAGDFLASFLPVSSLEYPVWWAYSISLFLFFVALPFSRYLHIPTEAVLIAFRRAGLTTQKRHTGFTEMEVHSCSRCGICIDVCQINVTTGRTSMVPAYYLQNIRHLRNDKQGAFDCLMCGRCQEACPVGISVTAIRQIRRTKLAGLGGADFKYLKQEAGRKAEVIYFAGCMTHLTPSIHRAITSMFNRAGIKYWFMDNDGTVCCGRPLQLAGKVTDAWMLREHNKKAISESGARILVTSCPICLKYFRAEYHLNIETLHHTEYIERLAANGTLKFGNSNTKAVYHDPCELGRGLGEYEKARSLASRAVHLVEASEEKSKAVCCGGSIAGLPLSPADKIQIAKAAVSSLTVQKPDYIITSCPLCKKTFQHAGDAEVKDIAEVMEKQMI